MCTCTCTCVLTVGVYCTPLTASSEGWAHVYMYMCTHCWCLLHTPNSLIRGVGCWVDSEGSLVSWGHTMDDSRGCLNLTITPAQGNDPISTTINKIKDTCRCTCTQTLVVHGLTTKRSIYMYTCTCTLSGLGQFILDAISQVGL